MTRGIDGGARWERRRRSVQRCVAAGPLRNDAPLDPCVPAPNGAVEEE